MKPGGVIVCHARVEQEFVALVAEMDRVHGPFRLVEELGRSSPGGIAPRHRIPGGLLPRGRLPTGKPPGADGVDVSALEMDVAQIVDEVQSADLVGQLHLLESAFVETLVEQAVGVLILIEIQEIYRQAQE